MSDIEDDIPQGQDMISFAINRLDEREKAEARAFLDQILGQSLSDKELSDIWFRGGARIGFMDESHYRMILDEMRRRLAGAPASFEF
ncbi:MAG: hypothetical protein HYS06_05145 [Methylocystis sp.]|nr:hypothetical protein [Methylocystis sp.]